jgi:hypothetical protein
MPAFRLIPDDFPAHLLPLVKDVDRLQVAFDAMWPKLMELRRLHFEKPTEATKANMEAVIRTAEITRADLDEAIATLCEAAGIDPDELAEEREPVGDPFPRLSRASIMANAPAPSGFVEDFLPQAIELIERHAPPGWLEREPPDLFRLSTMRDDQPISIVKGVRLESNRPKGHRLRQTLTLAKDFLALDNRFDHFAGALAVTQLAQLGRRLEALAEVGGAQDRIDALFSGAETDAIIFELLVASACAAKGRNMVFVEPTNMKSPDLRCTDSFNMVVECKRSNALTDYEIAEEARMRGLFDLLHAAATVRGQFGKYELTFSVEASEIDIAEVAKTCHLQRLAARPERALDYPWGSVAFRPLAARFDLVGPTKAYSPNMLEEVFGWTFGMPEWDGFICKIAEPSGAVLDRVTSAVGMAWCVATDAAITKRSRAPLALFAKAVTQMPVGEFGLVYVAYPEGARSEVADNRTDAYIQRIQEWVHDAKIRIPATFLVRQFAMPVDHGNPDMIESTVKFRSEAGGGDEWVFKEYPSNIFTKG